MLCTRPERSAGQGPAAPASHHPVGSKRAPQPRSGLQRQNVGARQIGASGAGKSILTKALLGTQAVATRGIREDDAKGRRHDP